MAYMFAWWRLEVLNSMYAWWRLAHYVARKGVYIYIILVTAWACACERLVADMRVVVNLLMSNSLGQ